MTVLANTLSTLMPGGEGGGGLGPTFFILVGWAAIFYFILIRPQRQQAKKHEERLKQVKKGDEVVTSGGIIGEIIHLKDDRITIKSGESRFVIERQKIAELRAREDQRFVDERPRSRDLLKRARASMPAGVPMSWMVSLYAHAPVFVEEAKGAYITDVDGHR